jgi:hypothetical protein
MSSTKYDETTQSYQWWFNKLIFDGYIVYPSMVEMGKMVKIISHVYNTLYVNIWNIYILAIYLYKSYTITSFYQI